MCLCVSVQWNTRHGEVLAHTQFYVPAVNHVIDFVEDFFNWINPKENVNGLAMRNVITSEYLGTMDCHSDMWPATKL